MDDVTELKEGYNARAFYQGTAIGNIDITHTGGGSTFGIFGDVRAYNARADYGGNAYGSITIRGDGNIYGLSGYSTATNAVSAFLGHNVTGVIDLYSKGNGDVYGMMISKDDIPGVGQPDTGQKLANWFAFNAYASGGGDNVEGTINIKMRETAMFMACTAENSCLTPCLTADRTKREIRTAKPRER